MVAALMVKLGSALPGTRRAFYLATKKESAGQSLVEFALMFMVFMFLMAGLFDLSRAIFYYSSLSEAAKAGARYGIVHGANASPAAGPCNSGPFCACDNSAAPNSSEIRAAVLSRATGMDPGSVVTTCSWPDQNSSGTYLNGIRKRFSLTVSYTYHPILTAFIPAGTITLLGSTTAYVQY